MSAYVEVTAERSGAAEPECAQHSELFGSQSSLLGERGAVRTGDVPDLEVRPGRRAPRACGPVSVGHGLAEKLSGLRAEQVERARELRLTSVGQVHVDRGRLQSRVTQEQLQCPQIRPGLDHVRRVAVPQHVRADPICAASHARHSAW